MASDCSSQSRVPDDYFATTHWSVVLTAGCTNSSQAVQALEELCQRYWYPLYAFIRHQGHSREEAEDLTQAFFASFLKKNYLENLRQEKGRFRAFLLACVKHFLANAHDRANRKKRGGGALHLALDWQSADENYQIDLADNASPDRLFDRTWVVTLLERVMTRLAQEKTAKGDRRLFDHLRPFLMLDEKGASYQQAAAELKMSESALRVAAHRLRRRYQQLLREEVAATCNPEFLEEELQSLLSVFVD